VSTISLIEDDGSGIVVEGAVFGGRHLLQMARRPADADGEEVLEGGADLDADHVRRQARVIIVAFQHVAERLCEWKIMRGDDGAGVAPDREFACNAGTADGGDFQRDAGAALHFRRDAIG
jgi:hypothetical protein